MADAAPRGVSRKPGVQGPPNKTEPRTGRQKILRYPMVASRGVANSFIAPRAAALGPSAERYESWTVAFPRLTPWATIYRPFQGLFGERGFVQSAEMPTGRKMLTIDYAAATPSSPW